MNKKDKKHSDLNVPDNNQLNILERNAKQRSIKISKKKKATKKKIYGKYYYYY